MEHFTLNNGVKIPAIGYGVYRIAPEECQKHVEEALHVGYRLIDTAAAYRNESGVGAAVKASGIPREELFITTKLMSSVSEDDTVRQFDRSMSALGLDYVDLFLIHQPFGDIYGSWRAMEKLYEQGRIKSIGVSNFNDPRLVDLLTNNDVIPVVNQIQLHPYLQRKGSVELMLSYGVIPEAWGPLAQAGGGIFEDKTLLAIASAHNKTVAQVVLRWHFQRGVVTIPKTANLSRMEENIQIFDFSLTDEDMDKISTLDRQSQYVDEQDDPAFVRRMCQMFWKKA